MWMVDGVDLSKRVECMIIGKGGVFYQVGGQGVMWLVKNVWVVSMVV